MSPENNAQELTMIIEQKIKDFDEKLTSLDTSTQKSLAEVSARIDRIEAAHEQALVRMDKLEALTSANASMIKELGLAVNQLFQVVSVGQQNFEVIQQNFEVIVTQIKGTQTENNRILSYLFGEQES
ncbi:MAG: hypothetical protein HC908_00535 [Calothrix sp. SM1_7_51]|nr:hypothetical protein [Calothrix sp. SM1_7_51]